MDTKQANIKVIIPEGYRLVRKGVRGRQQKQSLDDPNLTSAQRWNLKYRLTHQEKRKAYSKVYYETKQKPSE